MQPYHIAATYHSIEIFNAYLSIDAKAAAAVTMLILFATS